MYSIFNHEFSKFLTYETGTIISHHCPRYTKLCEEGSKLLYGAERCRIRHGYHLDPFSVRVHHHQKHVVQHRPGKVQMKPGPGLLRPTPWLERCLRGCCLILLALMATADNLSHILVHARPPHMHPGQPFHPCHTRVTLMELL